MPDGAIRRAFSKAKGHAVTWWFPLVAAPTAAGVAWLLGVRVTFAPWLPENSILRSAIDAVVLVVIAYVLLFSGCLVWFSVDRWVRRRVNLWLFGASVSALFLVVFIGGYIWDRARGPVIWDWSNWLSCSWDSNSTAVWVNGLQMVGWNRGNDPILVRDAYIRSDVTGDTVKLNARVKAQIPGFGVSWGGPTRVIPAGKEFMVSAVFPSVDPKKSQGISADTFLDKYSQFSFFLNGILIRQFNKRDVDKQVARQEFERRKWMEQYSDR